MKDIGIKCDNVTMDFDKLQESKDKAVTGLTSGIEFLLKKNKVDYLKGWGKFNSANGVDIDMNDGT
jgi:dihydrolipoamide dehydrogenase